MAIPWEEIKTEYITQGTSYAQLAKRYGISKGAVGKRATRERWVDERERFGKGVYQNALEEAKGKAVDRLRTLRTAAEQAAGIVARRMERAEDMTGRDMRAYTAALRDLNVLLRDFYDVPTPAEAEARRVAAQRLELERRKLDAGSMDRNIELTLSSDLEEWAQ